MFGFTVYHHQMGPADRLFYHMRDQGVCLCVWSFSQILRTSDEHFSDVIASAMILAKT